MKNWKHFTETEIAVPATDEIADSLIRNSKGFLFISRKNSYDVCLMFILPIDCVWSQCLNLRDFLFLIGLYGIYNSSYSIEAIKNWIKFSCFHNCFITHTHPASQIVVNFITLEIKLCMKMILIYLCSPHRTSEN